MNVQELINSYNNSKAGSQTRKDVFRKITENGFLLSVKPQGVIWPKRYLSIKSFCYAISSNQILIRDVKGQIIRKIRFADVVKMESSGGSQRFTIIFLTVAEKNNPP